MQRSGHHFVNKRTLRSVSQGAVQKTTPEKIKKAQRKEAKECLWANVLCTYQCQGSGGEGGGIGQVFDRSLWPGGRAFEFSCCRGSRDI